MFIDSRPDSLLTCRPVTDVNWNLSERLFSSFLVKITNVYVLGASELFLICLFETNEANRDRFSSTYAEK